MTIWIHLNHPCSEVDIVEDDSHDLSGQGYIKLDVLRQFEERIWLWQEAEKVLPQVRAAVVAQMTEEIERLGDDIFAQIQHSNFARDEFRGWNYVRWARSMRGMLKNCRSIIKGEGRENV